MSLEMLAAEMFITIMSAIENKEKAQDEKTHGVLFGSNDNNNSG